MQEDDWYAYNQGCLCGALASLKGTLKAKAGSLLNGGAGPGQEDSEPDGSGSSRNGCGHKGPDSEDGEKSPGVIWPSALETVCSIFCLSSFERDLLLLCAGAELDSSIAALCSEFQGGRSGPYPTFSLALAALPGAHWSALSPGSPLRRFQLIEVIDGGSLMSSQLRIDERILHYLVGIQYLDERLSGIVEPIDAGMALDPSHMGLAEKLTSLWQGTASRPALPLVQLCGGGAASRRSIASAACSALGLDMLILRARNLPGIPGELSSLIRLWEREAALRSSVLLLEMDGLDPSNPAGDRQAVSFVEGTAAPLILSSPVRHGTGSRPSIILDIPRPRPWEQSVLWREALGPNASGLDSCIERLASHFHLEAGTIQGICSGSIASASDEKRSPETVEKDLWDASRSWARPQVEELAQRVEPSAAWYDLVLPEHQLQILRDIALQVRNRAKVYYDWGFAGKGSRGLGISALFAGASGTGKTMAAEVLAGELELDLYRVDLASVVSKYIGETEKNLKRIFDAAEAGGSILLFDEADALFGKRSEVKDSHDRYANVEISYLLQRMEAYRGLAILTTNMKSALDPAFLRRIRFVVQFPFPDISQRAEMWRRVFPSEMPVDGLNFDKLARLNVTGANIRNIAVYGAFLAADAGKPLNMSHLQRAACIECEKIEKPISEAEIGGWV